ncbi:MAG: VOC family protein [Gemmatimonadetes bacterium]|nr:VOC family protein [Gemmatimonadota bacterium]MCC6771471.1 VOC family protein [Gemmatimonadaceae bacterium]
MSIPATSLSRIGQVAMPAREIARAVAFYRDTLGLRLLFEAPPKLAFFDCGGVRLMLAEPEGGATFQPGSILYYVVDDLAAAHAALVERGVSFVHAPQKVATMPDHELWMAFLHDSEGNTVGLMSEVRP